MQNGYWKRNEKKEKIFYENLAERILNDRACIIMIDGKSLCGKSLLIKSIPTCKKRVFSCDNFHRYLISYLENEKTDAEIVDSLDDKMLCIEDIDFLAGRPFTQWRIAKIFNMLAVRQKIIITGIQIKSRLPDFFENLKRTYAIYKFIEIQ